MPQVDLETLVLACTGGASDGKIACETLSSSDEAEVPDKPPEMPSDLPPDSFWLSKDAEFDWFDRHAFFERKDSGKGGSVAGAVSANSTTAANSIIISQRFSASLKTKSSIFGIPKLHKKNRGATDSKHRKTSVATLFPKRTASLVEPSSPKVSCMGRVRSKKDRSTGSRSSGCPRRKSDEMRGGVGFFSCVRALFFPKCRREQQEVKVESPAAAVEVPARKSSASTTASHDIMDRLPAAALETYARSSMDGEPPGLGMMKRFASGRRSDFRVSDSIVDE